MKYAALLLLISWSIYLLKVMPDLKPSDNPYLFILGCCTIMYAVVNIIIEILEFRRPNGS